MATLKAKVATTAETATTAICFLRAYLRSHLAPVLGDDAGEIASWVVVTALVIVAAIVIVGVVVNKLKTTANNIQTP